MAVRKHLVLRFAAALFAAALMLVAGAASASAAPFTGKVKIAAVQTSPILFDKAGNLADMEDKARDAAAEGADLIVFPELSLTGYKYRSRAEMAPDAEPVPGPSTAAMAAVAEETKTYIAFGLVESDGDALYDGVVLVGPEGYVGKYEKITMGHQSEAVLFTRGPAAPPVFDTSIGRIGLASCYDGAFPENARLMGLGGAQIMVLIDTENGTTWRDYVRTRAVENGAFAVVANRIGSERNSTFNGFSLIADPEYNLLASASTNTVETVSATVDLGDTSRKFVLERRPELYRAVTKPMTPAVLGVDAEPQSSIAGAATDVNVSLATTALPAGTPIEATIRDAGGNPIAATSGALGVDQGVLSLTVPASAPVGTGSLEVSAGGSTKTIRFTVKDQQRPGVLGTMPADEASTASTVYVGFDSALAPSASVPIELTGGGQELDLTGTVNQSVTDNRVAAPYTGLLAGTTYTVTVPAGAVQEAGSGTPNEAFSFTFTTAAAANTVVGGVAQITTTALDKTANVAAIAAQMEAAAAASVKFLVFPELSITGADFASRSEAEGVAEPLAGPSVAAIAAKAAELNMTVVVGLPESAGGKLYDTSVLIGPSGVIGSHRSTQLSDDQVGVFDAGNTVSPVFDTAVGPVGLVSGYENYFPEVARSLSIRGALLIAGGYDEEGTIWRELARTRGSEDKIYMLAANQSTAGGKSVIASTSRAINAELTNDAAGFAKATLNLTTIANRYFTYVDQSTDKARTTHYYLDRRPQIYAPISAKSASGTTLLLDKSSIAIGGGDVIATATVTGSEEAAPAGEVVFSAGAEVLGEVPVSGGAAALTVPSTKLKPGHQVLTATYVGSEDLAESSGKAAVEVAKATPSLTASLLPASVIAGQGTAVGVSVTAAGVGSVDGSVAVTVAGQTFAAPLSGGSASVPLPGLAGAGSYPVAVHYAGDDLVAAADRELTLTVAKATPSISVKLARRIVPVGGATTAKVRISAPGLAAPDGTVTVRTGGRARDFRLVGGSATVKVPAAGRGGAVKVTVSYGGSDALNTVSKKVTLRVKR